MVGEQLANLCHEYGPGNTSQEAHGIAADAPVLGPHLYYPERFLEVLGLLASQF